MRIFAVGADLEDLVLFKITRSTHHGSRCQYSRITPSPEGSRKCAWEVNKGRFLVLFVCLFAHVSVPCIYCMFGVYSLIFFPVFLSKHWVCTSVWLCLCCWPTCMFMFARVGYHRPSTAFNEGDERKINIVALKMISSHPFIASHFHPFIVWERVYGSTEREKIWIITPQCHH